MMTSIPKALGLMTLDLVQYSLYDKFISTEIEFGDRGLCSVGDGSVGFIKVLNEAVSN